MAEPAADGRAEILVAVRERPAAVRETAVTVLVRGAGRLQESAPSRVRKVCKVTRIVFSFGVLGPVYRQTGPGRLIHRAG